MADRSSRAYPGRHHRERGDALHEGHRRVPAVRVFRAGGADPDRTWTCRSSPPMCWRTPALRDGIKQFSQWPTIPQLYVKGEFVGGCDIITEMFQSRRAGDAAEGEGRPRKGEPLTRIFISAG